MRPSISLNGPGLQISSRLSPCFHFDRWEQNSLLLHCFEHRVALTLGFAFAPLGPLVLCFSFACLASPVICRSPDWLACSLFCLALSSGLSFDA